MRRTEFRKIRSDERADVYHVEIYSEKGNMFPVGVAYVVVVENNAQLNFIFVADQWRRQGFARELIREIRGRWPNVVSTLGIDQMGESLLTAVGLNSDDHESHSEFEPLEFVPVNPSCSVKEVPMETSITSQPLASLLDAQAAELQRLRKIAQRSKSIDELNAYAEGFEACLAWVRDAMTNKPDAITVINPNDMLEAVGRRIREAKAQAENEGIQAWLSRQANAAESTLTHNDGRKKSPHEIVAAAFSMGKHKATQLIQIVDKLDALELEGSNHDAEQIREVLRRESVNAAHVLVIQMNSAG